MIIGLAVISAATLRDQNDRYTYDRQPSQQGEPIMELNKYQRKWVDELRNGGHAQGTGMLARSVDAGWEYCCLGVAACKVFKADEERIGCHGILSQANELADAERKLGLIRPAQGQLASLNDEHGLTFAQIADVVERMVAYGETPMNAASRLGYVEE